MRCIAHPMLLIAFVAAIAATGCSSGEHADQNKPTEISGPPPAVSDEHDHSGEHEEAGPHGGHLIELGRNHKYHAELVENDATEAVTVYILDTHMKELAIDQQSVVLSLTASGQTTPYELAAVSDGQNAGHSRFESTDKALFRMLEHDTEVTGKLRVTIDGVSYTGQLAHHDHDHATHRH